MYKSECGRKQEGTKQEATAHRHRIELVTATSGWLSVRALRCASRRAVKYIARGDGSRARRAQNARVTARTRAYNIFFLHCIVVRAADRRIGDYRAFRWHIRCTGAFVADRARVVVASPDPVESAAIADWLSADGFEPVRRPTPQAAAEEMRVRPCSLLIADAALVLRSALLRTELRAHNSLTPTILIGDDAEPPQRGAMSVQPMFVARPIDRTLLACYVSLAVLDGRPTRRSARKPVNRFDAVVNGVPSHIVDVSAEGLRLEVARDRRVVLPPYFTLQVPLAGIAVTVQRMWTRSSPGRASAIWCGGALSQNRSSIAQGWQRFVDTLPVATHIAAL